MNHPQTYPIRTLADLLNVLDNKPCPHTFKKEKLHSKTVGFINATNKMLRIVAFDGAILGYAYKIDIVKLLQTSMRYADLIKFEETKHD